MKKTILLLTVILFIACGKEKTEENNIEISNEGYMKTESDSLLLRSGYIYGPFNKSEGVIYQIILNASYSNNNTFFLLFDAGVNLVIQSNSTNDIVAGVYEYQPDDNEKTLTIQEGNFYYLNDEDKEKPIRSPSNTYEVRSGQLTIEKIEDYSGHGFQSKLVNLSFQLYSESNIEISGKYNGKLIILEESN